MNKRYETCMYCRRVYSISAHRDTRNVYICQDCAEENMARVQHRPPRLIYDRRDMATVRV